MDRSKATISIFDKFASQYQDKFMDYEPYVESYKYLSTLLKSDSEVLDVACGPGNISKFLLNEKPQLRIHGIDLSAKMIGLAQSNAPGAVFEIMDSRDIALLPKQYDAILCGFCFPYLSREDVSKFIADARKRIRDEGIFYISTMEGNYENSGFQSKNDKDQVYTYYYQSEYLLDLLTENGFDILHTDRKSYETEGAEPSTDLFIYAQAS